MSRIKYFLENFEEILVSILLPLMVVIIFAGTAGRYSKLFLLPWAEELARYIMIWVVFLGIGAGAKRNAHFMVEVLMLILPEFLKKYLRIFTSLFIAAFMAALIYYSSSLIQRIMGMQQRSPSLGIPIWTGVCGHTCRLPVDGDSHAAVLLSRPEGFSGRNRDAGTGGASGNCRGII